MEKISQQELGAPILHQERVGTRAVCQDFNVSPKSQRGDFSHMKRVPGNTRNIHAGHTSPDPGLVQVTTVWAFRFSTLLRIQCEKRPADSNDL